MCFCVNKIGLGYHLPVHLCKIQKDVTFHRAHLECLPYINYFSFAILLPSCVDFALHDICDFL